MYKKGIKDNKTKGMLECHKQVSFSKLMRVERSVVSSLKISMENMEWNKKAAVAPFTAEKEEGEGNAVDMRIEEEIDVKEVKVVPSQKSSNRGTGNFLVSRRTNALLVRIKEKTLSG